VSERRDTSALSAQFTTLPNAARVDLVSCKQSRGASEMPIHSPTVDQLIHDDEVAISRTNTTKDTQICDVARIKY